MITRCPLCRQRCETPTLYQFNAHCGTCYLDFGPSYVAMIQGMSDLARVRWIGYHHADNVMPYGQNVVLRDADERREYAIGYMEAPASSQAVRNLRWDKAKADVSLFAMR